MNGFGTSRLLRAAWVLAIAAAAVTLLGACSGYRMEGRVIQGDYSAIEIVPADDPRLKEPGLSGVSLHLQSDPNKLNRETVARTTTGAGGDFSIDVDLPGAGLLIYEMGLFARREGFTPAERLFELPSKKRRVLITMTRGADRDLSDDRYEPLQDYETFR